ncbi:MAG TPA: hypothetical protein VLA33_08650 [Gemmatimonadota bacterium]|nr:hypothetical protein [Gemmatimonadota bacterium]
MNTNWTDKLSEYLDGELDGDEVERLESRLAVEPRLRALLEELRAVKRAASERPHFEAPAELWHGVRGRIEPARRTAASTGSASRRRRLMFTLPQLAAAAGVVLLLGVGIGRMVDPAAPPIGGQSASVVSVDATGPRYPQFVADLEGRLGAGRDVLDPETVRVIEQSLATIDSAIVQARTALEADPNNVYLNQHLASARAKKLRLLEDATTLIAART